LRAWSPYFRASRIRGAVSPEPTWRTSPSSSSFATSAREITHSGQQTQAVARLAEALTAAGDHDRARQLVAEAERTVREITEPWQQQRQRPRARRSGRLACGVPEVGLSS
jgi:hypothetical protein